MKNNISKENNINDFSSWEFTSILDSISDAVFIDDNSGRALWCNKACMDIYKISLDQVLGMHIDDLERKGIFSPSVAKIVFKEKQQVTIIHENQEGRKLLSTGTPILDTDNQIRKVVTTSRDISELSILQNQLESKANFKKQFFSIDNCFEEDLVANSPAMKNIVQLARKLAIVNSTVLISGESGVGKGVVAKFLQKNGNRKDKPFITVNCGAIPDNLIESELFGYEKGAFTGAKAEGKEGLFEAAQNGTLFLDEISELPISLQVKLLQVIQDRFIIRVGGTKHIPVDVRIISATNKDLHSLVEEKKFRKDLYYRLNVVPIIIPPLRERPEDIMPLIEKTLCTYNDKLNQHKSLSNEAADILVKYPWPGNVRELQNILERLIITSNEDVIPLDNLPRFLITESDIYQNINLTGNTDFSLYSALNITERKILLDALKKYKSTRAIAKALKISQPTVVRKLQKHNIKFSDT